MSRKYTADAACFEAVQKASQGKLTREEIEASFQRVYDYKQKLDATGDTTGMAKKLADFAEKEAERTRIMAALARRHAALNVLVRQRQEAALAALGRGGITPAKALYARMMGTQRGVEGGRSSVATADLAFQARYIGGLFGAIQAERPHLLNLMRDGDAKLNHDVEIEMGELRTGGKPGLTGNKDAQFLAKQFAITSELMRTDLNDFGASIGKLDGRVGPQVWDTAKMIFGPDAKSRWINFILPKLDVDRSFPDAVDLAEVTSILDDIYDTIITGMSNKLTPRETGQRVNPANLAKSLGKSRVLHFTSAEAGMAARKEYGTGTAMSNLIAEFRDGARTAALMEQFGPNPEVMFASLVDGMRRRIKESTSLTPNETVKLLKGLDSQAGKLRQAMDVSTGLVSRPVNVTAAKINADIRAGLSMAKLGGALFSSIGDAITAASASQFRGGGWYRGLVTQINGMRVGRSFKELTEVSYLLGEGFDGFTGYIAAAMAAEDGPVGRLSGLQNIFFRLNGLTWFTDAGRRATGRMISAEMAMRAKTGFAALDPRYRHVLELHNIDSVRWEAIRKAKFREINGNDYITPDMIRTLDDATIAPIVADRLAKAKTPEARAKILAVARRDLELKVAGFVADETSYGIVEVDDAARRFSTQGTRPGTTAGEAARFLMQFKGWPTAFTQRILGRAFLGGRKGKGAALEKVSHIGHLMAGLAIAGYMTIVMKDMLRGYWPPRNPADPKTWGAALSQGGALGIYGDFLFAQTNRFGGGLGATVVGPTFGTAIDLGDLWIKARNGDAKAADFLSLGINNTPFLNLFYVRPALDFLFLNSLREATSPGYLKRQEKNRRREYGQSTLPILGDRRAFQ